MAKKQRVREKMAKVAAKRRDNLMSTVEASEHQGNVHQKANERKGECGLLFCCTVYLHSFIHFV